jgi:hypothetical protein
MGKISVALNQVILDAALQGLADRKNKLDEQIAQVHSLLRLRIGGPGSVGETAIETENSSPVDGKRKRILSPEARQRIAVAQKKRWAAFRKNQ